MDDLTDQQREAATKRFEYERALLESGFVREVIVPLLMLVGLIIALAAASC